MIKVPLLIAQGPYDPLITARVRNRFVRQPCNAGQNLEYRTYKGAKHFSIVSPGSRFVADLLSWTEARLAGEPQGAGCGRISG
jgi:alpha-beta hydrolase superfamily lysophospholipase